MDLTKLGEVARRWLADLPQESLHQVRVARDAAGDDIEAQRRLSLEDRRAFAREFTRDNGLFGAALLAPLIPAEQLAKGAMSLIPAANAETPGYGRSGFHDPITSIGAGWTGILQGMGDRWLSGGR